MTILFNRTDYFAFKTFGTKKPDCEGSLARGNLAIRDYFLSENVVPSLLHIHELYELHFLKGNPIIAFNK
jgi:hypothetical protein